MTSSPKLTNCGDALREIRQEAGLSLGDLAELLQWNKGRLSKYETGRLPLSVDVIEQIATTLHLRPEAVILKCVQCQYPALKMPRIGALLEAAVEELKKC